MNCSACSDKTYEHYYETSRGREGCRKVSGCCRRVRIKKISGNQEEKEMLFEESVYRGRPVFVIKAHENDKYPYSFGVSKAKKILASVEEIKKFVERNDKPYTGEEK
jgi:hypothetical protein